MRALTLASLFGLSLLAGCVGVDPQQQRLADDDTCRSYGFRPGSQGLAECLQRIDLSRDADRRAFLYGNGWGGPGYGPRPFGRW